MGSYLGGIPSGPVALLVSRFRRTIKTSSRQRFNSDRVDSQPVVEGGVIESIGLSLPFRTDEKYTLKSSTMSRGQDAD